MEEAKVVFNTGRCVMTLFWLLVSGLLKPCDATMACLSDATIFLLASSQSALNFSSSVLMLSTSSLSWPANLVLWRSLRLAKSQDSHRSTCLALFFLICQAEAKSQPHWLQIGLILEAGGGLASSVRHLGSKNMVTVSSPRLLMKLGSWTGMMGHT